MPVRVKIAQTAEETDQLFCARHEIFVEEEGYFKPNQSGRIFDQFDALPSTVNIIAMVGQEVVGGLRITECSGVGTPSEHLFDFGPHIPTGSSKVVAASMLCIKKQYRKVRRLQFMLLSMGIFWVISRNVSHVIAAINPLLEHTMRGIGFKRIQPPFANKDLEIEVLPMLLNLKDVSARLSEMARFQGFHDKLKTFEREFFRAGEKIIQSGDKGNCAYVIIDGRVTVSKKGRRMGDQAEIIIAQLGAGEIFGELSLLTRKPRSTDVIAETDTDLMVIDGKTFQNRLLENPDLQYKLLELLGNRLRGFYLSELKEELVRQRPALKGVA